MVLDRRANFHNTFLTMENSEIKQTGLIQDSITTPKITRTEFSIFYLRKMRKLNKFAMY